MAQISKEIAGQIVDTVKDVCGHNINFIRPDGIILASTDPDRIGTYHEIGRKVAQTGKPIDVTADSSYSGTQPGVNMPFFYHGEVAAVIGISGHPNEVKKYAYLAQRITGLLITAQEYDARSRNADAEMHYFVRSLVHGEAVSHDFYLDFLENHGITPEGVQRAHAVRGGKISSEENSSDKLPQCSSDEAQLYLTVVVRLAQHYNPANLSMVEQDILSAFQKTGSPLYTFEYPNEFILIVQSGQFRSQENLFKKTAEKYGGLLRIGAGAPHHLIHQSRSYTEAETAVRAAEKGSGYADYSALHLEILLASVSERAKEQFTRKTLAGLDAKDRQTLRAYFESGCHLKDTAQKLYIHKNTLQYRLDRIKSVTGFDPRIFAQGVVLYLAIREDSESVY